MTTARENDGSMSSAATTATPRRGGGVRAADPHERALWCFAAFVLVVVMLSLHFTGEFDGVPQLSLTALADVCPASAPTYMCAYGAPECHAGRCYSTTGGGPGTCSGAYSSEAWLLMLRNCAQPVWWPWFVTAFVGVWGLVRVPRSVAIVGRWAAPPSPRLPKRWAASPAQSPPHKHRAMAAAYVVVVFALVFAAAVCASLGATQPYVVLMSLGLAVAANAVAHGRGRSAAQRRSGGDDDDDTTTTLAVTRWERCRVDECVSIVCLRCVPTCLVASAVTGAFGGFDASEANQVYVGYAAMWIGFVAIAGALEWYEAAAFVATFVLVIVFWALSVPFTWFVWPAFLCFVVRCVAVREGGGGGGGGSA